MDPSSDIKNTNTTNPVDLSNDHEDIQIIKQQCGVDESTATSLYVQANMNVVHAILLHIDPTSIKETKSNRSEKQQHFDKMRELLKEKDKIMDNIIKSAKEERRNPSAPDQTTHVEEVQPNDITPK